jgi:hypothetical protein
MIGQGLELDHRPPTEPGEDLLDALEGRVLETALDAADRRLARAGAPRQRPLAQARPQAGSAKKFSDLTS